MTTWPPEVTTSSTTVSRAPPTSTPSASWHVPYVLASLRTKHAGMPGHLRQRRRQRHTAELEAGERVRVVRHERRERFRDRRAGAPGSLSKRYLSKYSLLTAPDRSVNVPVR